jgi:hypothetical protein
MKELSEVASDAHALADELAKANRLPSDFPATQLLDLLVELKSLPTGTAEGCRRPLEYARARLPAIRRKFIQTEEQSRQSRADEDAPPPLTRGMTIDLRIGVLINSVTTALDEYRALASVEDDDAADTAPSLEIDATSPDVVNALAASRSAELALGEHVNELERIAEPSSVTADSLKRQMRDTRGLLSLARIELRMPAFVPRWYHKTLDTLGDYPLILRTTANAILIGVDLARPLVDAWHHFKHGLDRLVIDSVEQAAKGLAAVAQKREVERRERKDEAAETQMGEIAAPLPLDPPSRASSLRSLSPLGPLQELPGTWTGKGFNVIWRPSNTPGTDHFLELNLTNEILRFERIHGAIPNRGLLQPDIAMFGLSYQQTIADAYIKGPDGKPVGLHFEPGIWATVPQTEHPLEIPTVVRMGTIPHGTTFVAQGVASTRSEGPNILDIHIYPFVIGAPAKVITFPEQNLSNQSVFRTPPAGLVGIDQAIVDNPNLVLRRALEGKTVKNTVVLDVSSDTSVPIFGGGVANTAFLQGSPSQGPNAQAALVRATYWIETVQDDPDGPDVQQLQYTQTVLLNFNGLSWPHITVATLRKSITSTG